jgi:hypothetical protein
MSRRLKERLLLTLGQGDPAMRTVFLLVQVIIPTMMLRPHSLRLEVTAIQQ